MTTAKIIYIGNERLLPLPHEVTFEATDVDVTVADGKLIITADNGFMYQLKPEKANNAPANDHANITARQDQLALKKMLDSWQPLGEEFDDAFEFEDLPLQNKAIFD